MSNEDLEQSNSQTGQDEQPNSETGHEEEQADSQQESGQETETSSQESGQKDPNSQLYARAKKAEEELKKERAKAASYEQQEKVEEKISEVEQDPVELAKAVRVLKDYEPEELDVIKQQSKALNMSPAEAAQNEDVQAIIEKRREKKKVEQSNPAPTNRQEPPKQDFSQWTPKVVNEKLARGDEQSLKEVDEYYKWLKHGG